MTESVSHHETIVRPTRGVHLDVREVWVYRELLGVLAWRSILARYKQTLMGVLWAVVRPAAMMGLGTLVFGRLFGLSGGQGAYSLVVLAGVLAWQLFSQCVTGCTNSLVTNAEMVRKVYFPRLIIPTSECATALVDFLIGVGVLAVWMAVCGQAPTWRVVTVPLWTLLAVAAGLGPGLLLAALNARYRDVMHVVPFLISIGLFVSPVFYVTPVEKLASWRALYAVNPMAGVIEGFRWALLPEATLAVGPLLISIAVVAVLLAGGVMFFQYMQRMFADVI
ncbi:MAG: ABC transporter permease [Planctomycetota bacterium]|jgi:lipopolysaccharide transport system permease protein